MSDPILVQRHDKWTEITLDRPDRLNSFNDEMHAVLVSALKAARDGGVRANLAAATDTLSDHLELGADMMKTSREGADRTEDVLAFL
jgi:enoyl-CoA hydratase/carnithine racemase